MQGIYAIVNTINGKRYIGSAVHIRKRWEQHRRYLRDGIHHCSHLQRAWDKYGADSFRWDVLEEVLNASSLLTREQAWIDATPIAERYNSSPTAGSNRGCVQSPEVRRKHAQTWLGKHHSAETRAKISAVKKGIPRPRHLVEASAAALRGRKRPPEVVQRIGAAHKGKVVSDATRQKQSDAKRGKPWTDAQRAAIMAAKAKPVSDETRRKLSAASRGHRNPSAKLNEEQVAVIRQRLAAGEAQRSIAKAFDVHQWTVWAIANNKKWTQPCLPQLPTIPEPDPA